MKFTLSSFFRCVERKSHSCLGTLFLEVARTRVVKHSKQWTFACLANLKGAHVIVAECSFYPVFILNCMGGIIE